MNYKIGIVGLGVMGHNLALNMERNGFPVAGYDLDATKTKTFLKGPGAGKQIIGVDSPAALMAFLEKPRLILLMVPAGAPVSTS
jgi:6-phosphogluconate dehydrogenase